MAELKVTVTGKSFAEEGGGRKAVIAHVAFRAAAGERIAITGPSGCGKTTLLNIVAGLDSDFEGRVERPPQARLGYVFQEPRLLPWRSVEDNLRLVLEDDEPARDLRIRRALDEVGLLGEAHNFAAHLSLGMARRAAIARAFVVEPAILLLDEPFVSLDEPTARRLRFLLLDLLEHHRATTLFVTHNLREAIMVAERLLVLSPPPTRVVADLAIPLAAEERPDDARIEAFRHRILGSLPELGPLGEAAP